MSTTDIEIDVQKKTCRVCGETKPLSEYHKDRTRGDGYKARCASCMSRRNLSRTQERQQHSKANAQRDERKSVARVVAIKRLVEAHTVEFQKLLADEYVKAGVDPTWQPLVGDPLDN
jgi:hypothetical protein